MVSEQNMYIHSIGAKTVQDIFTPNIFVNCKVYTRSCILQLTWIKTSTWIGLSYIRRTYVRRYIHVT